MNQEIRKFNQTSNSIGWIKTRFNKRSEPIQQSRIDTNKEHKCDENCRRLSCILRKTQLRVVGTLAAIFMLVALPSFAAETTSAEKGYFLNTAEKKELIWSGEITDSQGNLYDVNFVPGYRGAGQGAVDSLESAATEFEKYGDTKHYQRIADSYRDATGTIRDVVRKTWAKGIPEIWSDAFERASNATDRQTFGWPLAYPWAFCNSTLGTFGVLGLGTAQIGGVSIVEYGVGPAYLLVQPGVTGVTDAVVAGAVVPAAQLGWNTAVAPPLAMLGRKPSPERADGFFVEMKSQEPRVEAKTAAPISAERSSAEQTGASMGCCAFSEEFVRTHWAMATLDMYSEML